MRWGQSDLNYTHDHDIERAESVTSAGVGGTFGASYRKSLPYRPMTAGRFRIDAQRRQAIGDVFTELRVLLGLSDVQAAQRLGTSINVIEALEAGELESLPDWHETRALVVRYTALANINPETVLAALAPAFEELPDIRHPQPTTAPAPAYLIHSSRRTKGGVEQDHQTVGAPQSMAMRRVRSLPERTMRTVRRRPGIAVFALIFPIAVIMLSWWSTSVGARPVSFVADRVSVVLSAAFASVYNGHRWIEVEDPRSRRGDKLQSGHR